MQVQSMALPPMPPKQNVWSSVGAETNAAISLAKAPYPQKPGRAFNYLGSLITSDGRCKMVIGRRVSMTPRTLGKMGKVFITSHYRLICESFTVTYTPSWLIETSPRLKQRVVKAVWMQLSCGSDVVCSAFRAQTLSQMRRCLTEQAQRALWLQTSENVKAFSSVTSCGKKKLNWSILFSNDLEI